MTDRIDHAAEALNALGAITGVDQATNQITLALEAQARATLALVEQQRIANILATAHIDSRYFENGKIAELREKLGL